jgi:hypothetical protein
MQHQMLFVDLLAVTLEDFPRDGARLARSFKTDESVQLAERMIGRGFRTLG